MEFNIQGYSDETQDMMRSIYNLLSIPKGSIPLAREMGISWGNLSKIPPDMENDIAVEIVELLEKYEPRAAVEEITFEYNSDGEVYATIKLEEGEEE